MAYSKNTDDIRLNLYIASTGFCSRRKADKLITAGQVQVDNVVVTKLGSIITKESIVTINGSRIVPIKSKTYIILNKPKLVITSKYDEEGRTTIMEFIPKEFQRLFPVGRLDYDASGLLILTDDGDLANKLMHPKYRVPKTYALKCDPEVTKEDARMFIDGVKIEGGTFVKADKATVKNGVLLISIHEGRYHHIKRMAEAMQKRVVWLKRVEYSVVKLGDLQPGQWRFLTTIEVDKLKKVR